MRLRIGVVQFSPNIGQVHDNVARAHELCKRIQPGSVDLLCFPEMALTGYVFKNAASIRPYLEQPRTGTTSRFCAEIAKKLQCHVLAGYPEALSPSSPGPASKPNEISEAQASSAQVVGANSAVLYGRGGEFIGGYRKTHLFETDKTWATAGTGFATFTLPPPIRTLCLGICMDLNAQTDKWMLPDGPYELASHCLSNKANILVLLNAWLDSGTEPDEPFDWGVLAFWAARLRPLWAGAGGGDEEESLVSDDDDAESGKGEKETIVVVCNRCGEENGITFAGSSAIFSMRSGSGRPKLLDMMERREEGVRIWDIQL